MDFEFCFVAGFMGMMLNIILSFGLAPFASDAEQSPPDGASKLSYKEQFMHMLYHHQQVILTSSFIVFIVVFLSCAMADGMF